MQKDGISTRLLPFGCGDGGGGPTRDHLEYLRRLAQPGGRAAHHDRLAHRLLQGPGGARRARRALRGRAVLPGPPRHLHLAGAHQARQPQERARPARGRDVGRGRAAPSPGTPIPCAKVDEAWKKVLLNQFHDIIPGSSIHRVYEEAEAAYDGGHRHAPRRSPARRPGSLTDDSRAADRVQLALLGAQRAGRAARGFRRGRRCSTATPLPVQRVDGRDAGRGDGALLRLDHPARRRPAPGGAASRSTLCGHAAAAGERAPAPAVQRARRDRQHLRQGDGPRAGRRARATA